VGTIAAICIQTPLAVMQRALKIFKWVIRPPARDGKQLIGKIVEWSNTARKQGLLGLEPMIAREDDDFLRKALQLVVDGSEPETISNVMYVELNMREHADTTAAKVFEGMGVYSPTLGIIGAVLGLMAVLQNLADPSKLGHGIAAAFTATVYGIGLANLFFLPVAAKLKVIIQRQTQFREMVIDGMLCIAQGENPRSIEAKLQGYLH
jgi:chemotaxis protein MotA